FVLFICRANGRATAAWVGQPPKPGAGRGPHLEARLRLYLCFDVFAFHHCLFGQGDHSMRRCWQRSLVNLRYFLDTCLSGVLHQTAIAIATISIAVRKPVIITVAVTQATVARFAL